MTTEIISKRPAISGVTMVRNAEILDYPFKESVRSVLPLCSEFIINCGFSNDRTRAICDELKEESPKIRIIESEWMEKGQSGGFQLKDQTDRAVREAKGDWCFVIQADEAIHEADYEHIFNAIALADEISEIDGVLFDYLHFYGSHYYTIRGRNWYRREVRAFKTGRGIEAFRDAQGFRKNGKRLRVIPASARVFHYGYVRSPDSLKTKSTEMAKWWGKSAGGDFNLHRHVGLKRFAGTHPGVMSSRISRAGDFFDPSRHPRKWDSREIKNALTLAWEGIFPFRIGEFKNYDLIG